MLSLDFRDCPFCTLNDLHSKESHTFSSHGPVSLSWHGYDRPALSPGRVVRDWPARRTHPSNDVRLDRTRLTVRAADLRFQLVRGTREILPYLWGFCQIEPDSQLGRKGPPTALIGRCRVTLVPDRPPPLTGNGWSERGAGPGKAFTPGPERPGGERSWTRQPAASGCAHQNRASGRGHRRPTPEPRASRPPGSRW